MKFMYWAERGRGEIVRLLAVVAGIEYEDQSVTEEDWPELKSTALLGQIPVLTLNDNTVLPQSLAMARYLARKHGLAGKPDDLESAKMDAVVDTALDANLEFYDAKWHFEGDQQKDAVEKLKNKTIPLVLQRLQILKNIYGSEKHMVGDKLSWADLYVFDSLINFEEYNKEEVEKYEDLLAVSENIKSQKEVDEYLKSRIKC
ncbi:hypothetical protein ACOME3_005306 [Neoechinorhynchus agilis]